jgi:putative ABC transport system substrate-binding protein
MTTRRQLLIAFCASSLTAPAILFAQQQGKVWRVGFLAMGRVDLVDSDYTYGPLTQGLRELGYVLGKNLVIEWRSAEGQYEQKATTSIPILMINVADPLGAGLVKSLARPGGNSTAISNMINELGPKLLETLRGVVPKVTRVSVLVNPTNPANVPVLKELRAAAEKRGVTIQPVGANAPAEIAKAFAVMARQNARALIVLRDPFFQQQRNQILELVAKQRLPSIGTYGEFVEDGGLVSYGTNIGENNRRAATFLDKIFKGANPGDIPVEQPLRFELFINLKTAKALGIKVPQSILLQATKVIE